MLTIPVKAGRKDGRLHLQLESWLYDLIEELKEAIEAGATVNEIVSVNADDFASRAHEAWDSINELQVAIELPEFTATISVVPLAALIAYTKVSIGRMTSISVPAATATASAGTPVIVKSSKTVTAHSPE